MEDKELKDVLIFSLEILKQMSVYLHRLDLRVAQIVSVLSKDQAAEEYLLQPLPGQDDQSHLQRIDVLTRNIDATIQTVKRL